MDINTKIIDVIILIFSVVVHEVSHGLIAEKFGDDTAREAGRITLNPLPHIDPVASIIMPLLIGIGAAKPVPVNFENLQPKRLGMALVSLAGPVSNFLLAVIFLILIRLGLTTEFSYLVLSHGVFLNILLGVFNLLPIPPLDGSKIVLAFAPERLRNSILRYESYGFIVLAILVFSGLITFLIQPIYSLIIGLLQSL